MELFDKLSLTMIIIVAIIIVIGVLIATLYANKMQEIAELKGYEGSVWGWNFFLVFFLGVFGMGIGALMVIALPKNENHE